MRHIAPACAAMLLAVVSSVGASLPDDPALATPVTLAVKREALADIGAVLESKTGVHFRVSKKIADRKATIFVDEMPLRELMERIAECFRYQWSASQRDGRMAYELWEDEKTRRDREEAYQDAWAEAWDSAFAQIREKVRYALLSPAALESAYNRALAEAKARPGPETDARMRPLEAVYKRPLIRPIMHVIAASPFILEALRKGESIHYTAGAQDPRWRLSEALAGEIEEAALKSAFSHPSPGLPDQPQSPDEVEVTEVSLGFSASTDSGSVSITANCTLMYKSPNGAISSRAMVETLAQQPLSASLDEVTSPTEDSGPPPDKSVTITKEELIQEADVPQEVPQIPGMRIERSDGGTKVMLNMPGGEGLDPSQLTELLKQIAGQKDNAAWINKSDIFAILHRKLGLQIISDHYSKWETCAGYKDQPLEDVLGRRTDSDKPGLRDQYQSSWRWDGTVLYRRVKDIRYADAAETPNRLLRPWQAVYARDGALGLDQVAEIALLEASQLESLTRNARFLKLGMLAGINYDAVRVYSMLAPDQRSETWTQQGLSVAALSPAQREALRKVLAPRKGITSLNSLGRTGVYRESTRIDGPPKLDPATMNPVSIRLHQPRFAVKVAGEENAMPATGGTLMMGIGHNPEDAVEAPNAEEALKKLQKKDTKATREQVLQLDAGRCMMEVALAFGETGKMNRQFVLLP